MAGGGGGAWKVAYADFVTAMMAFFLVMWITAQNDKVKEAIADHFNEPDTIFEPWEGKEGSPSGSRHRGKRHPPKDSKEKTKWARDRGLPKPRATTVRDSDEAGVETVVFFVGEAVELDAESQQRLAEFAKAIAGKPQKVEIRGHTWRRPLAENSLYKDVWQLSYARCIATMELLERGGIAPERIRLSQAGEFEPYRAATGSKRHEQDPRVEVFLLNETLDDFRRRPLPNTTAAEASHPAAISEVSHAAGGH
jgi:chemotaxis protein MotB